MSQQDVHLVERELGIILPSACASYLRDAPFAANSFVVWQGLVFQANKIIESTRWNRAHGFFGQSWPHDYLVIGFDSLGNEFFVDVTEANSPVFLADHEGCSSASTLIFEQCDTSLSAWIDSMRRTEETIPDWLRNQALEEMEGAGESW